MQEVRELHLELGSSLDSADAAELIVQRLAEQYGFSAEQVEHLGMAARESMVNAIVHGNGYSSEKHVRFSVVVGPDKITVTVRDEGSGFNPTEVPDPLSRENILRGSGRGLLLIRAFVDQVEIHPAEPSGTELVMVKYTTQRVGQQSKDPTE
jgi:serine/threonine-protein kinase RsbW